MAPDTVKLKIRGQIADRMGPYLLFDPEDYIPSRSQQIVI